MATATQLQRPPSLAGALFLEQSDELTDDCVDISESASRILVDWSFLDSVGESQRPLLSLDEWAPFPTLPPITFTADAGAIAEVSRDNGQIEVLRLQQTETVRQRLRWAHTESTEDSSWCAARGWPAQTGAPARVAVGAAYAYAKPRSEPC
jgi:hypothetical protein